MGLVQFFSFRRKVPFFYFSWAFVCDEVLMRILLGALIGILSVLPPFKRIVPTRPSITSEENQDSRFQIDDMYGFTLSETEIFSKRIFAAVGLSSLLVVFFFLLVVAKCLRKKKVSIRFLLTEWVILLLGIILSFELTYIVTEVIKVSYGGLRPAFLSYCSSAIVEKSSIRCANSALEAEGRKSFPSAHGSLSFSLYFYLSLILWTKLSCVTTVPSLQIVLSGLPLLLAAYIGLTRIQEYRHFPIDVVCGSILGLIISYIVWTVYDRVIQQMYLKCLYQNNDDDIKGFKSTSDLLSSSNEKGVKAGKHSDSFSVTVDS